METFLNILANLSIYVLNKVFEIKYLIKSYFIKNYHVDTVINDIYFINTRTKSILEINNDFVKNINNKLKYSTYITLNHIFSSFDYSLNNEDKYLIEIKYTKNNRTYLINMPLEHHNEIVLFPMYTVEDIKHKNMNKITEIIGSDYENELLFLLTCYGGPLNDFYIGKNLGVPLMNIYSKRLSDFPFREGNYMMNDIFLNEYRVGSREDIKVEDVLVLKNTLDSSKIIMDDKNDKYILTHYKKMTLDWKEFIFESFNYIFRRQKVA